MDYLADIVVTFVLVGVSEIGDKSQLLLIALAARRPRGPVVAGGMLGIVAVQAVAIGIGGWVASTGIAGAVAVVVGVAFVVVGLAALIRGSTDDPTADVAAVPSTRSVVMSTAAMMFVAELGDKTMFASAGLASVRHPVAVFAGATAAFLCLTVAAVVVGARFGRDLSSRLLTVVGGAVMVAVGAAVLIGELW